MLNGEVGSHLPLATLAGVDPSTPRRRIYVRYVHLSDGALAYITEYVVSIRDDLVQGTAAGILRHVLEAHHESTDWNQDAVIACVAESCTTARLWLAEGALTPAATL